MRVFLGITGASGAPYAARLLESLAAADCEVVLTDKKISRKHATVRFEGGEFQIADLDSSNGCFVNDEKVQKHDLIDNDIIKLGDIQFEFKCRAMREKRE